MKPNYREDTALEKGCSYVPDENHEDEHILYQPDIQSNHLGYPHSFHLQEKKQLKIFNKTILSNKLGGKHP